MSRPRRSAAQKTPRFQGAPILEPPRSPDGAHTVKFEMRPGEPLHTFWSSDEHIDSPECWRELLFTNWDEAVAKNALIFNNGDLLDVVSARSDHRGTKDTIRVEDATGHYLDTVVSNTAELLHPYRNHLAVIGTGNHEASVYKRMETDLTQRVVDKLNTRRDSKLVPIQRAGYRYWVVFQGVDVSHGSMQSKRVVAYHGSGGGGEVSKGAMQAQRKMAIYDADVVVLGHIHERWSIDLRQERLSPNTKEAALRQQRTVQLGSYKRDWRLDGAATWHTMRSGGTPKPLGGAFITFGIRAVGAPMAVRVLDPEVLDVEMR